MKKLYQRSKFFRIVIIIGIILLIVIFIGYLFLKLWKPLGGNVSLNDKKEYERRSSNYQDGKFYNENDFRMIYNDNAENKFVSEKALIPVDEIPIDVPTYLENPSVDILNITWFGHSTLLLQMHGMNILIDPVFSERSSPVSFIGPERFSDLPVEVKYLPDIDIVVITHDHYDHLDYYTIKEIDHKVLNYVVPLGIENHLERWGVFEDKIIKMAWWEEIEINDLLIACTPARHYSSRNFLTDRYSTLWSSWVFRDEYHQLFASGDTGFDEHFAQILDKYGSFDLALLDSGQYDVKWKSTHMTPEEAVEAGKVLQAKVIMPIHWGTFKLANHPWDDPVERFTRSAFSENIKYITPKIGQTITYGEEMNTTNWWREIE